jgi:hypothetical protein
MRLGSGKCAVAVGCVAFAVSARAAEPRASAPEPPRAPVPPEELSGVDRPAREAAAPARDLANALLWPFRSVVDLIFLTTGAAGGLLENEQIVPRAREFFFTSGGDIGLFPTVFLETGTNANVGARFIASAGPLATTIRAGYGGPDANVAESRLQLVCPLPLPAVLSLEGMHDRRTNIGYLGLGQTPEADPRNQFRTAPDVGYFRERRERIVVGYGMRPLADLEVLLSASYAQRHVDDPDDAGASALSNVFAPESTPGALRTTRIVYGEMALRYDSRLARGGIDTGALLESYAGLSRGVGKDETRLSRMGFRAAGFFPFVHRANILSPKIVVDAMLPGDGVVPFREFTGQPSFRGFDNRRDYDSAVASLDYRWYVMRFVAARLFLDVAKVFPTFAGITFDHVRYAGGFGFDLHSSRSEIGRVAISGSPEGVGFLLTLGVPAGFGDRQHRD